MARNEQQTRFELIEPMLLDPRGWSREDISVEETAAPVDIVYCKGRHRPKGRTDYVLRHLNGLKAAKGATRVNSCAN